MTMRRQHLVLTEPQATREAKNHALTVQRPRSQSMDTSMESFEDQIVSTVSMIAGLLLVSYM